MALCARQGQSPQQLARIKAVVQFAVYAAYRLRLETALLADQTASAAAAATAMEPPQGSPEAGMKQSPFQAAARQDQTAAQAAVQSPLLQQGSLPADGDTSTMPAAAQLQAPVSAAWSEQQYSRTAELAHDMVEASVRLAAANREGRPILSCSPHVTCSPAEGGPQAEAAAAFTGSRGTATAAGAGQQAAAAAQQPAVEAGAGAGALSGGQDNSHAAAAASPPLSAQSSPRPSAAIQGITAAQRLFMSTACRNPTKKLLCEPSMVQVIHTYESGGGSCSLCEAVDGGSGVSVHMHVHSRTNTHLVCRADKPLAAFLAGAFPAADRKCGQPNCGDGATHHLRTFVNRGQRVTLSVAQLPAGQELPGGGRGQVRACACRIASRVVLDSGPFSPVTR